MKNEIIEFINRRFYKDCDWTNGNCYWFSLILQKRFPNAKIYYMPITGHFITKIDNVFYDATGIVIPEEKVIDFKKLEEEDSLWYEHLIRDCFL